jgi:superfamily I DNA/RNA helicase
VFLCDLEEGVWPNYRLHRSDRVRTWADLVRWLFRRRRIDPEADLAEERRLFYVGVTRAARRLYLLSARRKSVGGRTRRFEPSRFLGLL